MSKASRARQVACIETKPWNRCARILCIFVGNLFNVVRDDIIGNDTFVVAEKTILLTHDNSAPCNDQVNNFRV